MSDLEARIDRLESLDEIRQLAAKYSLAFDMRDADAWLHDARSNPCRIALPGAYSDGS